MKVIGHSIIDHFADVGKMIAMPKGAEKEVPDLIPSKHCAMNKA